MVAAVAMVKDEADVVEHTLRHMATQVDHLIVADNGSTDGTREILDALEAELPLHVIDDHDPAYYQSVKVSRLAAIAAEAGAEWVVPMDADEWHYSPFGRIADVLAERPEAIATAALYDHVATGIDPDDLNPTTRIAWRRVAAGQLPKVACRPVLRVTVHQGNHSAGYPGGTVDGLLVIRHFPYRSAEQFIRKARNGAAAYAVTDLAEDVGAHWRGYGRILDERGPDALADVFREHFWCADPRVDPDLIFDPAP